MRLPKLTIRRAMITVAIASIPLGLWSREMYSRRQFYLGDVAHHARREAEERRNLAEVDQKQLNSAMSTDARSGLRVNPWSHLRASHHAALKRKYQRAADHPWESVAPDPAEPGVRSDVFMKPVEFPMITSDMLKALHSNSVR